LLRRSHQTEAAEQRAGGEQPERPVARRVLVRAGEQPAGGDL